MRFKLAGAVAAIGLFVIFTCIADVQAAQKEIKIGTISILGIREKSNVGQEAKKLIETKANEFQEKFKGEQAELEKMRDEIEKKSSVWSMDVRSKNEREYQKKFRELQMKTEDAKFEIQQLTNKIIGPLFKDLDEIIAEVGKREGYTIILENSLKGVRSQTGLLYTDDTIDISDLVLKELNARSAAAQKK